MASWGSAFVTAFKILLASIVWVIVGVFLMMMGIALMGFPMMQFDHMGMQPSAIPSVGGALLGFILMLAGYLIATLGILASFLKYSAEFYAREVITTAQRGRF